MAKEVILHLGINNDLHDEKLRIPDDAIRPWDGSDHLRYVGGRTPRVDGRAKTTGAAVYTYDVQLPGMLYAAFVTSSHPAAIVKKVDMSKAGRYPGVKAVHITADTPFPVRFHGQEIAAVAATSLRAAQEAAALVAVEYEERPFTVDIDAAMKPGAPMVFTKTSEEPKPDAYPSDEVSGAAQRGNIKGPEISRDLPEGKTEADLDAVFSASDALVDETYSTQVQTHSCMEPHGVVVRWEEDGQLTVWASTQAIFGVRDEMAGALDIPVSRVRVITDYMGGGFGSKFSAGIYGVTAAHLAKKAKAPVWLMYDRKAEQLSTGNRPGSVQHLKIAGNRDGKLTAIKLSMYGTAGVATGAGTAGPAKNLYACDYKWTEESDVFINAGPGCAFRAPGHPPGIFALEQAIDELSYKLNIDPLELRRKNTMYDQVRQVEYDLAIQKAGWSSRNPTPGADKGIIKRGIGIANSLWYYFVGSDFQVAVQVNNDGTVEVVNGVQDLGTGIRTALAVIAGEELGLDPSSVKVRIGDTNFGVGPGSGGSVTTGSLAAPTRDAAYKAKMKMIAIAAKMMNVPESDVVCADGKFSVTGHPDKNCTWRQVAAKITGGKFTVQAERQKDYRRIDPSFLRGVQIAEVDVDTETGIVHTRRIVAVHDCGRPINRLTLESQINGGIIQGLSYALFENRILDRNTGIMVNPNLEEYKIAGSMDIPKIETVIIDHNTGINSAPAMGIGEPATVPTAAAIANAVFHATGVRVRSLPITPDKVLAALAKRGA